MTVRYAHEYDRRLRALHLGCGPHSYRNVLPAYRYAPIELAAVCDRQEERARAFARQFGAQAWYTDFARALDEIRPEVVFLVAGYLPDGRPAYPELALQALRAGAHVWMEKPPAATSAEIETLAAVSREANRVVMVGLKKAFFPAIRKAKEITRRPEFGAVTSLYVRYPQSLPPAERRGDLKAMQGFLDHLCHPASILHSLGGPFATLQYRRCGHNGAVVATIEFRSGAIGCLHLCAGISGTSPLERVEVVGQGANVIVENGCRLLYYRPGARGGYGRAGSFIGADESAPWCWEPEFSLGQLYNSGLFLLGYAPEIVHFCECVLGGAAPEEGGLDAALAVTQLYEAFAGPEGAILPIGAA
mgnify:CR=1 FL=1